MIKNKYIDYIQEYVNHNTPVTFELNEEKYHEIEESLKAFPLTPEKNIIISSMYSLFYTSLTLHKIASENQENRSYNILIGDYISSYVAEILYQNEMFELLKIFSHSSKKLLLNILNNNNDDQLLNEILSYCRK